MQELRPGFHRQPVLDERLDLGASLRDALYDAVDRETSSGRIEDMQFAHAPHMVVC
jgi:hypothetical protein